MWENQISPKQQLFVQEFLVDLNATQAAIRAGYSRRNADKIASELMGKTRVRAEIDAAMDSRSQRTGITQDRVLEEIGRIAFSDPRRAFDQNGNLLDINDWPDDVAAAVSSLKVRENCRDDGTPTTVREIKFWDKGRQLELACRHLGLIQRPGERQSRRVDRGEDTEKGA